MRKFFLKTRFFALRGLILISNGPFKKNSKKILDITRYSSFLQTNAGTRSHALSGNASGTLSPLHT